jgi:hypothetical protein
LSGGPEVQPEGRYKPAPLEGKVGLNWRDIMPIEMFDLARNLKISRFTIDVLMQRLMHLNPRRASAPDECERFVGQTQESVTACDQLLSELRDRLYGTQPVDVGTIASLSSGFEELHRKITESIARLNSFEFASTR